MQLLFHILPLRLLIVAWPNRDLVISALHLLFVAISQDRLVDTVSLSTVCEPDVFDGKDCFELSLHILGALRDASSGTLRDTVQPLFYARQITRFPTLFSSSTSPIHIHSSDTFLFPDPLFGSNAWILASGLFNLMLNHLKNNKISFVHFPGSSSQALVATCGQLIIWWKTVAALPFWPCLIWLHTLSWQKLVPLSIGCQHFIHGNAENF
jgi:hypothetical protein